MRRVPRFSGSAFGPRAISNNSPGTSHESNDRKYRWISPRLSCIARVTDHRKSSLGAVGATAAAAAAAADATAAVVVDTSKTGRRIAYLCLCSTASRQPIVLVCDLALLKSVDLYPHEEHVYTDDIKTEAEVVVAVVAAASAVAVVAAASAVVAGVGVGAGAGVGAGGRVASRRVGRFFFAPFASGASFASFALFASGASGAPFASGVCTCTMSTMGAYFIFEK